jgi:hypothetical protein
MIGATPDLDPGENGCTGDRARGIDRIVPIDLFDQDLLTVNYRLISDDASLYLVTDCTDAGTCVLGKDTTGVSGIETAIWLNETGGPLRVYAVLDAFAEVTDDFQLDVYIDPLGSDVLVDSCVEAIDQGPVGTGSYHGTLAGHDDLLDPDCAAAGASGGEGVVQVFLLPGQTLTVKANTPGGNPIVYLVTSCSIEASCFQSSDTLDGEFEELVYSNGTPFSQNFYVVVDSSLNLADYVLDLEIQ